MAVSVRLDPVIEAKLTQQANLLGITKSDFIKDAIERVLGMKNPAATLRFELLEWIERGGVQVFPFDASHLGVMLPWMRRNSETYKRDMDLADASLLWLAHETGLREIVTVDVKDFARYRLPDGKALTVL